jgi:hypothetical protein
MYQEPEMIYRTAHRQSMTSYTPPLHRRGDSEMDVSLGPWAAAGEVVGLALLEFMLNPVAGIVVLVVSYGLYIIGAASRLCSYVKKPWGSIARTTNR